MLDPTTRTTAQVRTRVVCAGANACGLRRCQRVAGRGVRSLVTPRRQSLSLANCRVLLVYPASTCRREAKPRRELVRGRQATRLRLPLPGVPGALLAAVFVAATTPLLGHPVDDTARANARERHLLPRGNKRYPQLVFQSPCVALRALLRHDPCPPTRAPPHCLRHNCVDCLSALHLGTIWEPCLCLRCNLTANRRRGVAWSCAGPSFSILGSALAARTHGVD